MNPLTIIRIVNLILVIIAIVGWSFFHRKFREPAAIAPLTWLINLLIFYIYRFYSLLYPTQAKAELLTLWSSVIFTHGLVLLIFGVFLANARLIHNKSYMERLQKKLEEDSL